MPDKQNKNCWQIVDLVRGHLEAEAALDVDGGLRLRHAVLDLCSSRNEHPAHFREPSACSSGQSRTVVHTPILVVCFVCHANMVFWNASKVCMKDVRLGQCRGNLKYHAHALLLSAAHPQKKQGM